MSMLLDIGPPQGDSLVQNLLIWGLAVVGIALGGACGYIVKLHKESRSDRKSETSERKEMHERAMDQSQKSTDALHELRAAVQALPDKFTIAIHQATKK